MRLVLTVLARDEADIIDAQVSFHLNAGVDFVIATDNASDDGTTEVLESYERAAFASDPRTGGRAARRASGSRGWRASRRRSSKPTG